MPAIKVSFPDESRTVLVQANDMATLKKKGKLFLKSVFI